MSTEDARNLAIVAIVAIAPVAIVLIFAILRGYTITLHMTRLGRWARRREEGSDDD
jgi:hypothetical protein